MKATSHLPTLLGALLGIAVAMPQLPARAERFDVWIGTNTPDGGLSKGIYHAEFDSSTGQLSPPTLAVEIGKPGFLARHPKLDVLYSTGRVDGMESVIAYHIDGGKLTRFSSQPTNAGGATHIDTDRTGRVLFSAQYDAGSTGVYPLNDDGSIAPQSQLIKHEGGSRAVAGRQDSPHAHWVGASPDNQFVFVPDLGLDQVLIYRLDPAQAKLTTHGFVATPPGSGPRHFRFHPDGKHAYVVNELAMTVTVFAYDAAAGTLTLVETVPTLTDEQKAKETFFSGSEVQIHPSGKFLYAGNRGHDSITVFRIEPTSGKLTFVECEPVRGTHPRNFALDPTGEWLVAAGRDSNTLAVFAVDQQTGELTYTHQSQFAPQPICVLFDAPAQ